jgi:hypothetical protein
MSPNAALPKPPRAPLWLAATVVWGLLTVPACIVAVPLAMGMNAGMPTGVHTYVYLALALPGSTVVSAMGCLTGGLLRCPRVVAVSSAIPFVIAAIIAITVVVRLG